jgi:hypothetical protein
LNLFFTKRLHIASIGLRQTLRFYILFILSALVRLCRKSRKLPCDEFDTSKKFHEQNAKAPCANCGWEQVPRDLIRDRDACYGSIFVRQVRSLGIAAQSCSNARGGKCSIDILNLQQHHLCVVRGLGVEFHEIPSGNGLAPCSQGLWLCQKSDSVAGGHGLCPSPAG